MSAVVGLPASGGDPGHARGGPEVVAEAVRCDEMGIDTRPGGETLQDRADRIRG
jgi:hypothetical protein